MPFNKRIRPSIPTSQNNDLYSIDQSLLNFSKNYEPNKAVSCGHGASSSRTVVEPSHDELNNHVKKK